METFGERLRQLRGSQSQAAFASLLGIPQVTLGNYERNRNQPRFEVIGDICARFEVCPEWLLFGTGPMRPGAAASPGEGPHDAPLSQEAEARCAALESQLREVNKERRELSEENRRLHREKASLLERNAELRESLARLESARLVSGRISPGADAG